ncbi:cytochrome P450 [Tranquillimonas alkanivorans]|uniref:Fatty-acid peroxygenase n=1 Tax=Tranquillimonas alkanivorans TaxID=441119 RepID=A0A1I5REF1_9RHOB|nr:cytochrome P450 [Tranquillimonas alkanivorans]SFP56691.1 fatty-acid peroxygenase [Tranquillimonas alkanivorans]
MSQMPTETAPDSTIPFRADPYRFISKRCAAHGSDAFEGRLLLEKTIFLHGPEAAELFYDQSRFRRADAFPSRIKKLMFGLGGVQGLDGAAHVHRKAMHLSIMTENNMDRLEPLLAARLRARVPVWREAGEVALHSELLQVAAEAAAEWAGVPPEADMNLRRRQMQAMFEHAGSVGPVYMRARLQRRRADAWAHDLIARTRAGEIAPRQGSALDVIAGWHDPEGQPLPADVAGVELLNVLRPTTAVGVFLVFVVHALATDGVHPRTDEEVRRFVLEIRRHYPFFPAVGARTTREFEWKGLPFPEGRLVLLDIWGTNRDPRTWSAPDDFRPERFAHRKPGPFEMIPQGGGDHPHNHRCSGEWITERMMAVTTRFFVEELEWDAPEQDLSLAYGELPARPRDDMRISLHPA